MEIQRIIDELMHKRIKVKVFENDIKLIGSAAEVTPALIEGIRGNKAALLDYFRPSPAFPADSGKIQRLQSAAHYPVSAAQRRMWVLSQIKEGNIAYNMPGAYTFNGYLDEEILAQCFQDLVCRHESLRTVFKEEGSGDLRQYIISPENYGFHLVKIDLRHVLFADESLKVLAQESYRKPFDLAEGPLFVASLYRIDEERWVLVYVMHHIISDGWSLGVLVKELLLLYKMRIENQVGLLPELPIQYKDYVGWLSQRSKQDAMTYHRNYWLKQLEGSLPVLELAGDKPRPAFKSYSGGILTRIIGKTVKLSYEKLLLREGATLFMGLLTIVYILMNKYTGQDDIIIGTPAAGRDHPDLDGQIGLFVNTLPLRVQVNPQQRFLDLLRIVRETALKAYEHQAYPFNELLNDLNLQRDIGRNPIFDVMVVLQNTENDKKQLVSNASGFTAGQYIEPGHTVSKFDLLFAFAETEDQIQVGIEYSSDLFESSYAERMAEHFESILSSILRSENAPITSLDYLSAAERNEVLFTFNKNVIEYSTGETVLDHFERLATQKPENPCIQYEGEKWTYRQINNEANALSYYLKDLYQTKRGDLIGIRLERGPRLIISMLAVIKACCVFLPLDPAYPQERLDLMIENSGCRLVFDDQEWYRFDESIPDSVDRKIEQRPSPGDLAYILYTSGSTGIPKAVLIEHNSLTNSILAQQQIIKVRAEDRSLQFCSSSFDASLFEIFITLIAGASLYIVPDLVKTDPKMLRDFVNSNRLTMVTLPPTWLGQMNAKDMPSVNKWVTGGDRITAETAAAFATAGSYFNAYGPTEGCITATIFAVHGQTVPTKGLLSIGRPIPGVRTYVLDGQGMPCGIGVIGELYVGGAGVARGYLNDPDKTAARFVDDLLYPKDKMYRTGDYGRWFPDGNLEFKGRRDRQAKIRGYRIELPEIEEVLRRCPEVGAVHVSSYPHPTSGEAQLVAYLTGIDLPEPRTLRSLVSQALPAYMVPSFFVRLEKFPLTINGKVDVASLPKPEIQTGQQTNPVIPARGHIQKMLVVIWEEILARRIIDVGENFFELGGNSMLAARLVPMINKMLGASLSIRDLFRYPTIEELSVIIQNGAEEPNKEAINLEREGTFRIDPTRLNGLSAGQNPPIGILLTGATGFVGIYLLRELLLKTTAVVYCLVRAKDEIHGKTRIIFQLRRYGLYEAGDECRIVAVCGDLSGKGLSLKKETYEYLSSVIDYIYHSGANMDLLSDYQRLKSTNVGGSIELIRFAMVGKLKKLIYISTLSIFSNRSGIRYETESTEEEFHLTTSGYAGSKWVGEKIMLNAIADGLPGQVIRLGLITGDERTGRMPADQWFTRLLKTCYQMQSVPEGFAVPALPVDWIAQSIVKVSTLPKQRNNIFHLCNPDNIPIQLFFNETWIEGHHVSMIGSRDWLQRIYKMSASTVLPILPLLNFGVNLHTDGSESEPTFSVNMNYHYSCTETLQSLKDNLSFLYHDPPFYRKYVVAAIESEPIRDQSVV